MKTLRNKRRINDKWIEQTCKKLEKGKFLVTNHGKYIKTVDCLLTPYQEEIDSLYDLYSGKTIEKFFRFVSPQDEHYQVIVNYRKKCEDALAVSE